jgi:toxin-antitoxin system PIN domain toxin
MKLLDVNVWLAAAWARHVHHAVAKRYVDAEDDDMLFCRVTELAFLRLVTNRAVTGEDALTRRQAWDLLLALQADPRIRFAPEPRGLAPLWIAFSKRDDRSHLLWTDDYLAAFAQAIGAELVTLDAGLRARYPSVDVTILRSRERLS